MLYNNINNNILASEEASNLLSAIEPLIQAGVPASKIPTAMANLVDRTGTLGGAVDTIQGLLATGKITIEEVPALLASNAPRLPMTVLNVVTKLMEGAASGAGYGTLYQTALNALSGKSLMTNVGQTALITAALGGAGGAISPFLPAASFERLGSESGQGGQFYGASIGTKGFGLLSFFHRI